MPAKMTSTIWDRGFRNMLICGVGVVVSYAVIMAFVVSFFHKSAGDAHYIAAAVVCAFAFLAFLAGWIYGRATAGPVLLDCGPHPIRWLFLVQAVILPFMGGMGWYSGKSAAAGFAVSGPVFFASFAAFSLVLATGRLQIRENGIWQYWSLLRWGRIDSCEWAEDSTLLVKARGFLALPQGALPVPPEHRQAVAELLAGRCSVTPSIRPLAAMDGRQE
jgi:hypothetical protein